MAYILVVEDDILFSRAVTVSLEKAGHRVACAHSLSEAEALLKTQPDLLVLDLGLPDGSGIQVCSRAVMQGEIPVIFLTARDEEDDMLRAYDAGCDDYVVKPFPLSVLKKRIDAVLKRSGSAADSAQDTYHYRDLTIQFDRRRVFVQDREIQLTAKEYQLLELLARNSGRVITREQILERLWDAKGSFVGENTVSVTVNRLRRKLCKDRCEDTCIKTVFGTGYRLGD